MNLVLILWLTTSLAFADCPPAHEAPAILDTQDEQPGLHQLFIEHSWFSATPEQVQQAPCRTKRSRQAIERDLLEQNEKTPKHDLMVRGLHLKNQNQALLASFQALVTKRDLLGEARPDQEQADLSSARHCTDVLCASKALFGEDVGPKLLFMHHRYGMNGSDLSFADRARLSPQQIDSFIRALDDLPPHLTPLKQNRMMTLARPHAGEPGVYANATMTFFDEWAKNPNPHEQDLTCTHELGHVLGDELELDNHPDWLRLSGWEDLGDDDWLATNPTTLLSRYAATNPSEDFAESVAAYRYNPEALRTVAPEKYQFIKTHVYAGLEYLNQSTCQRPPPLLVELDRSAIPAPNFEELRVLCREELRIAATRPLQSNLQNCIARQIANGLSQSRSDLPELTQKTLARHYAFALINTPSAVQTPFSTVQTAEQNLKRDLRQQIHRDFINNEFSYMVAQGRCDDFSEMPFLRDRFNQNYQLDYYSAYFDDIEAQVARNYCQHHIQHFSGLERLDPIDAHYFIAKALRSGDSQNEVQIDQLHRRRTQLRRQQATSRELEELEQQLRVLLQLREY